MSSLRKLADGADVVAFGLTVRRLILRKLRARADNLTPAEEDPASFRNSVAEKYRQNTGPRVSCGEDNELEAFLMLRQLVEVVNGGALKHIADAPDGTKALLLAMCMPFCKACGYAGPPYALQSFMVWEQREIYRLFTSVFHHQDLLHLVSNLCGLADSGSFLEEHCGTATLVAATASLTASSSALQVLCSRTAYRRLNNYFHSLSVGASGLAYGLQVLADYKMAAIHGMGHTDITLTGAHTLPLDLLNLVWYMCFFPKQSRDFAADQASTKCEVMASNS